MTIWFVFNGDADGICAAHQLRLAGAGAGVAVGASAGAGAGAGVGADEARPVRIVTGVKRDVKLLERVTAAPGDAVLVADISLDVNRGALERLLAAGVHVTWFDHHHAGELPQHENFTALIDTAPDVCSSLLVDRHLGARYRAWAVTAAFGDNLAAVALGAASGLGLNGAQIDQLRELGALMNYNAYGETVVDLHVAPAALFARIEAFADPFAFIAADAFVTQLRAAMASDLAAAHSAKVLTNGAHAAAFALPDAPWARRVQGVFANELASAQPLRAHALLVAKHDDAYIVSVRAPQARLQGADTLCRAFATGGGRAGAAGINHLPAADLGRFLDAFHKAFDF